MTAIFINEFHYDNAGTDANEFIEIAGVAGTDLTDWSIVLYNGNNGGVYDTQNLTGTIPDQTDGFGTVAIDFPVNGIQNGSPDGIALVDNTGKVIQFLSYEGVLTAIEVQQTDSPVSISGSNKPQQRLLIVPCNFREWELSTKILPGWRPMVVIRKDW